MNLRRFYTLVGVLLIGAAVAGLIISIAGIIGVWRVERRILGGLDNALGLLDTTLQATADGLEVAGQSLDQADESLDTLALTIQTTGNTVSDTIPLIETISKVVVQDLPNTIESTQGALASAQSGANVIDVTLAAITSIPILPLAQYRPEVPLAAALGGVSDSLDAIPSSLASMEASLAAASTNLTTIEAQFDRIAADLDGISLSLTGARAVISQYSLVVATLQAQLEPARINLPRQLDMIAWFITLALIWLGLTQVGLLMQGLEMMGLEYTKRPPAEGTVAASAATPAPPASLEVEPAGPNREAVLETASETALAAEAGTTSAALPETAGPVVMPGEPDKASDTPRLP